MRTLLQLALALALLLGCGDEDGADTGAGASGDQDAADGADGEADGADGEADGADGEADDEPFPLSGVAEAPAWADRPDDLHIAAVVVRFSGSSTPALGPVLATAQPGGDGGWSLTLPARPDDADIVELERDAEEGTLVVLLAVSGPGYTDGETPLYGVASDHLALWLEEPSDLGAPAGWSLIDTGLSGRYAGDTRCLLSTDLPLRWRETDGYPVLLDEDDPVEVELPGVVAPLAIDGQLTGVTEATDGVAGVWYATLDGVDGLPPAFDEPAARDGAFAAVLDAPPPDGAWLTSDPDWTFAAAFVLPYGDDDGSGGWSDPDSLSNHTVCLDGDYAVLRYNRPVRSWRGYRFLQCTDARAGWALSTTAEDGTWTDWQPDAIALELTGDAETCTLFAEER